MIKKILSFLLLAALLFTVCGCYNYREIEHLAIVAGCAVDKAPYGEKFRLTMEIVDFGSGGTKAEIKSKLVESDGLTIVDAIRNAEHKISRELYWSNCQVLVISSDVARDGILRVLDSFNRHYEPRPTLDVVISEEPSAAEILTQENINFSILSTELDKAVESNPRRLSTTSYIELYKITNLLSFKENGLVIPAVRNAQNNKSKIWEINGTAIFGGDKLIGFLSPSDTKYLLFVTNSVSGGVLNVSTGSDNSNDVAFDIFENETKISHSYADGKLTMQIDTNTSLLMLEIEKQADFTSKDSLPRLSEKAAQSIEENIKRLISYTQQNYGVDIFGFNLVIRKKDAKLWSKLKDNWEYEFKNLDVKVNSKAVIKNSGQTKAPVRVGESP